jgi:hypothetical protein
MSRTKKTKPDLEHRPRTAPAATIEARENQMISYAVDLAEKQLIEGTASAQVIVHYLKLGTTKERLEKEKLEEENKLLRAKTQNLEAQKREDEFYEKVLAAMKVYSGHAED